MPGENYEKRGLYYSWGPPEALSSHFRIPNLAFYVHSHPSKLPAASSLLPHGSSIGVLLSTPGNVHPCKGSSWTGIEVLSPDHPNAIPYNPASRALLNYLFLGEILTMPLTSALVSQLRSILHYHRIPATVQKNILEGISPQCWHGFGSWHLLKTLKTECVDRDVCTLLGRHLHLQHKERCGEGS